MEKLSAGPVAAGARLDQLPVSSFHWRILGLIGAGMFLDAPPIFALSVTRAEPGQNRAFPDKKMSSAQIFLDLLTVPDEQESLFRPAAPR